MCVELLVTEIQKLREKTESQAAQIKSLEIKIQFLEQENTTLAKEAKFHSDESKRLIESVNKLIDENRKVQKKYEDAVLKANEFEAGAERLSEENTTLAKEVKFHSDENKQLIESVNKLVDENKKLQENHDAHKIFVVKCCIGMLCCLLISAVRK